MCWTVGLKGLRASPVGLYRDPSLGTRQMGIWQLGFFTAQGTPSRPPPVPFSSQSLARAPGCGRLRVRAQEAVPGRGLPTYPGRASSSRRADPTLRRPASSAGSISP